MLQILSTIVCLNYLLCHHSMSLADKNFKLSEQLGKYFWTQVTFRYGSP